VYIEIVVVLVNEGCKKRRDGNFVNNKKRAYLKKKSHMTPFQGVGALSISNEWSF